MDERQDFVAAGYVVLFLDYMLWLSSNKINVYFYKESCVGVINWNEEIPPFF